MSERIDTLTADLEAIRTELADIEAVENPTEEQAARAEQLLSDWDTKTAEREALVARAERLEAVRQASLNPKKVTTVAPEVIVRKDPFDDLASLRFASEEDVVARAVTAASETRYSGPFAITDAHRESAVRVIETVPGAAAYALHVGSPAYMRAFRSWLSSGGNPIYTPEEAEAVRASMSLTSANGGYTLPFLLDPTLIHTGVATKNPVRRLARNVTGTQNVWHGVTVSNVTTAWKSEGSAFTDGSPTTGGISVTAAMLTAYVTASFEIFQDSDLQSQLPGVIAESIDYAEGTAFVSGSGSGAPKGIVTAISATAGSTVTATTRGSFTSASAADTIALLNSVSPRFEDSVTWVANKQTFNTIRQQTVGTAGTLLFDMMQSNQLLGSPIAASSDMTAATTSGNVLIVLGDFSRFIVYDRLGVSLEFIPNVVDGSGVPTGQRGIVAYKRVGSDVADVNAFRFLKC